MKISIEELKLISEYLKLRDSKVEVVRNQKYTDAAFIRDQERQILEKILKISDQKYDDYRHYERELSHYLYREYDININGGNSFSLVRDLIINRIID